MDKRGQGFVTGLTLATIFVMLLGASSSSKFTSRSIPEVNDAGSGWATNLRAYLLSVDAELLTMDVNSLTVNTTLTVTGTIDANSTSDFDGTTNLDAIDVDGTADFAATVTIVYADINDGALSVDTAIANTLTATTVFNSNGTANIDTLDVDGASDFASYPVFNGVGYASLACTNISVTINTVDTWTRIKGYSTVAENTSYADANSTTGVIAIDKTGIYLLTANAMYDAAGNNPEYAWAIARDGVPITGCTQGNSAEGQEDTTNASTGDALPISMTCISSLTSTASVSLMAMETDGTDNLQIFGAGFYILYLGGT